jgi:hypothetical protein
MPLASHVRMLDPDRGSLKVVHHADGRCREERCGLQAFRFHMYHVMNRHDQQLICFMQPLAGALDRFE